MSDAGAVMPGLICMHAFRAASYRTACQTTYTAFALRSEQMAAGGTVRRADVTRPREYATSTHLMLDVQAKHNIAAAFRAAHYMPFQDYPQTCHSTCGFCEQGSNAFRLDTTVTLHPRRYLAQSHCSPSCARLRASRSSGLKQRVSHPTASVNDPGRTHRHWHCQFLARGTMRRFGRRVHARRSL